MPSEEYLRTHERWQRREDARLNQEAAAERARRTAEQAALAEYARRLR